MVDAIVRSLPQCELIEAQLAPIKEHASGLTSGDVQTAFEAPSDVERRAARIVLNRYVLIADVIVPADVAATVTAGEPGMGAPAGPSFALIGSYELLMRRPGSCTPSSLRLSAAALAGCSVVHRTCRGQR